MFYLFKRIWLKLYNAINYTLAVLYTTCILDSHGTFVHGPQGSCGLWKAHYNIVVVCFSLSFHMYYFSILFILTFPSYPISLVSPGPVHCILFILFCSYILPISFLPTISYPVLAHLTLLYSVIYFNLSHLPCYIHITHISYLCQLILSPVLLAVLAMMLIA